jgi:predicted nucleic acid-binding protein
MAGSFFDTNVLLYIASRDPAKAARAEQIVGRGGAISVQVLNELAHVGRRKMRLSWVATHTFLSALRGLLTVHPITINVHETGLALARRYRLATCDAMIAASAMHAGCSTLWSEDMQHGVVLESRLRILNPFRTTRRPPD